MRFRMFTSIMTGVAVWSTSLLSMAAFSNADIIVNSIEATVVGFMAFGITKCVLDEKARQRMLARKKRRKEMEAQRKHRATLNYYEYDEKALRKLRALQRTA